VALSHDNLVNYYKTNFLLMQEHKYSLTEIENMLPWEREIYIAMLVDYIEKENERIKQQNQG
jgi:hypothetical protein|tara:strand:- start:4024 stop:4209 length:186 start_codon:yes stop_codon:yes gene_type:complete